MVQLPPDVVAGIDKYAGAGQRSAFITELARRELRRREQQEALRAAAGAWKDEDHPELAEGSAAWVRQIRAETEERFRRIEQHRETK